VGGDICGACLQKTPPFGHTVAAFTYAFPIDKLIGALKFHENLTLVNCLADALARQVELLPDCIVAMPLHPQRLRERGFNQSLLLAKRISKTLAIPLLHDACLRTRNTTPQSSLPWKERDKNVRAAFSCSIDFTGQHVAIVDDVMTTGSSAGELAKVLRECGATQISAWVVARTLP
jgi:ComF family protein